VAFRNLTFYSINRIFLLLAIIVSTVYPFWDFTFVHFQSDWHGDILTVTSPFQAVDSSAMRESIDYWYWITLVYWVGVGLVFIRFTIQLFSLYQIHQNSKPDLFSGVYFRRVNEKINPFAFGRTIYLNPELHQGDELKLVLEHEENHCKDFHTFDVLVAEVGIILYWFNPVAWLVKGAIRENLEFIVDRRMLKRGTDRKAYQYSLVRVGSFTGSTMVNNYNLESIKDRIKMMSRKGSDRFSLVRYLCVFPLLIPMIAIVEGQHLAEANAAFERQMNDPEFQELQRRASSPELLKELEDIRKRELSPKFIEERAAFERQMNDPVFKEIQRSASTRAFLETKTERFYK
jgi:hypothetical protein